jgi:enterochelin esterase-like enzyme
MKTNLKLILLALSMIISVRSTSQYIKIDASFYSPALDTAKFVDIYLPQDYYLNDTVLYPVIYFLHGAGGNHNDYGTLATGLYSMVNSNQIHPFILVKPDGSCEPYLGSYYVNSSLYGNYEDFIIEDVVAFIESQFRVIPEKYARYISGHSMGGGGALRLGITYPDLFRGLICCSNGPVRNLLMDDWLELMYLENDSSCIPVYSAGNYTKLYFTSCGAFSPNPSKDPPIDLLYDTLCNLIDSVDAKWEKFDNSCSVSKLSPQDNLSFFVICGTNDEFGFYPNSLAFIDTLAKYNQDYTFLSYEGTHTFNLPSFMEGLKYIDSLYTEGLLQHADIEEAISIMNDLMIAPNPCSDLLSLKFNLSKNSNLIIQIIDSRGKLVFKQDCASFSSGNNSLNINVKDYPKGIYFLRFQIGKEIMSRKFVKY